MVLGDSLPLPEKRKHIRRQLIPWRILFLYCQFTKPPKDKYLLVVSVHAETRVFVISSEPHRFAQDSPAIKGLQIVIDVASHDFLDYDSHLDCSRLYIVKTEEIERQLLQDMGRIKGTLSPSAKKKVIAAIKGSTIWSKREKALILSFLEET